MVQQKNITNGPRREQSAMTIQRKDIADARVVAGSNKNDGRAPNGTSWIELASSLHELTLFQVTGPLSEQMLPFRIRDLAPSDP